MDKNFEIWGVLKQKIDIENHIPFFKEREIWWCCIGSNIGHEENGKNNKFNRPVLVIKKFNSRLFWGVPLTTKLKDNKHYHTFLFGEKKQAAMLTQMRLWDANRLTAKMGRIRESEFAKVKNNLLLYLK